VLARVSELIGSSARGGIATGAMSAVMLAGDRAGLMGQQPPAAITNSALRRAGVDRPSAPAAVIAPLAHLGFGAMGGLIYGRARRLVPGVSGWILGVLFGLMIWVVNYKGWIPASGILPPPEDDRPGRPAVMVAAHLVYGFVLGWLHG
jgi:hypothetical protein